MGERRYLMPMNPVAAANGGPKMVGGYCHPTSGRNVPVYSAPTLNGMNAVA